MENFLSNRTRLVLNSCLRFAQRALPAGCALCGAAIAGEALCAGCEADLPVVRQPRCAVCAQPLAAGTTCGSCLASPPAYDAIHAALAYGYPLDALIHAYKYGGRLALAAPLAALMQREAIPEVDALVPMPLAPGRLRERGFNQAHELARRLARALGVPVLPGACRKVRDTPPQAALPWSERRRNVRGAFVCDADFTGNRVAIVDDVMTTGATLDALAIRLKQAGAARVCGWVIARTLR